MNSQAVAALALSAATLIPVSPRRRVTACVPRVVQTRRRRIPPIGAAGIVFACIGLVVLPVITSLTAGLLGATVIVRLRHRSHRNRGADEARALETALEVLVGELRVGAHPVRAFGAAADETDQPSVAAGLREVAVRARLGADVAAGLRSVAGPSSMPALWERLAVYWQLGCEHGLAISNLMYAAQRDIAERQRFSARVDSGTAGARATATILAALPLLGVLLGQLVGANPVGFLLGGSGRGLLLAGVTLACVGLLWSDRITARVK